MRLLFGFIEMILDIWFVFCLFVFQINLKFACEIVWVKKLNFIILFVFTEWLKIYI